MTLDLLSPAMMAILSATISAVLFMVVWRCHERISGVSHWMLALTCLPLALYLNFDQNIFPDWLAIFGANLLLASAMLLGVFGCRKFFDFDQNNLLIAFYLFTPFVISLYLFTFIFPNQAIIIIALELLVALSIITILLSLHSPIAQSCIAGRNVLYTLCVAGLTYVTIMLLTQFNLLPQELNISPSHLALTKAIGWGVLPASLSLCFLILINQRTEHQRLKLQQQILQLEQQQIEPLALTELVIPDSELEIVPTVVNEPLEDIGLIAAEDIEIVDDIIVEQPSLVQQIQVPQVKQQKAQLLNVEIFQRQQQKSGDSDFLTMIEQLPQHLIEQIKRANEAQTNNEPTTLKTIFHQVALCADRIGLEQLAELALSLEFRPPATVTTKDIQMLSALNEVSISQLMLMINQNTKHKIN